MMDLGVNDAFYSVEVLDKGPEHFSGTVTYKTKDGEIGKVYGAGDTMAEMLKDLSEGIRLAMEYNK